MKIYIPVGIVASGKTTACKKWVEENQPAVHVEVDDLRTIFFKEYTYDPILEITVFRLMLECVQVWASVGYNVAVDDAVFFLSRRDRWLFESHLKYREIEAEVIWDFLSDPTDAQVADRRGREGRGISVEDWLEVAQRQRGELERD